MNDREFKDLICKARQRAVCQVVDALMTGSATGHAKLAWDVVIEAEAVLAGRPAHASREELEQELSETVG